MSITNLTPDNGFAGDFAVRLLGLHYKAQSVPTGKLRIQSQGFEDVERNFEPIGFLGIDVEANVVMLGQKRQIAHARHQFLDHAAQLGAAVAYVERR